MRFATALGLAVLGLYLSLARAEEARKADGASANQLFGIYQIVSGERAGTKLDSDRLKDVTVDIGANAIATFDKDKKQVYAATYKLDTGHKPWRITMTATLTPGSEGKGTTAEGLIEKKGDTVRLIYALPGGKAPTGFHTDAKQQLFVMKRMGK